jgi:uncharacterized membrane protein (Fun14 family)
MNDNAANSSDIISNTFLLGNVGAPFVIGMAVGYFARKMLGLALFVGGGIIVLMFIGEYYGIITVNGEVLLDAAGAAAQAAKDSGSFLLDRLGAVVSRGVSAVGGFYVGFKLG